MAFLIEVNELKEKIEKNHVIVIDVRSDLQNPDKGFALYRENHIPTAHYFHLNNDLSGEIKEHGGNHPLPDPEVFAEKLRNIGVNKDSQVVVYDEGPGMYAGRAWFVLTYVGVEHVSILNGGIQAWESAHYPLSNEVRDVTKGDFQANVQENLIVSMEDVRNRDANRIGLIDSRGKDRYLGKVEPLYHKAGHIPGAENFVWSEVWQENGTFKDDDSLKEHFSSLEKYESIIVSCGSGISACPNMFALKRAGFTNVKLYPGSFSDWISYEENDVVTDEK